MKFLKFNYFVLLISLVAILSMLGTVNASTNETGNLSHNTLPPTVHVVDDSNYDTYFYSNGNIRPGTIDYGDILKIGNTNNKSFIINQYMTVTCNNTGDKINNGQLRIVKGSDGSLVEGLTITNANRPGIFLEGVSYVTIKDNHVTRLLGGSGSFPLYLINSTHNMIVGNTFNGDGIDSSVVVLHDSHYNTITKNIASGGGNVINLDTNVGLQSNYNNITYNTINGAYSQFCYAIQANKGIGNFIAYNNIHGGICGIRVYGASNAVIINNTFFNNETNGIDVGQAISYYSGILAISSYNTLVSGNNITIAAKSTGISTSGGNITVVNNIINNMGTGDSIRLGGDNAFAFNNTIYSSFNLGIMTLSNSIAYYNKLIKDGIVTVDDKPFIDDDTYSYYFDEYGNIKSDSFYDSETIIIGNLNNKDLIIDQFLILDGLGFANIINGTITIKGGANHSQIRRINFNNINKNGILLDGSSFISISNSTFLIYENGTGIFAKDGLNFNITNNVIVSESIVVSLIRMNYVKDSLIENNSLYGNGIVGYGISSLGSNNITIFGNNITVYGNISYDYSSLDEEYDNYIPWGLAPIILYANNTLSIYSDNIRIYNNILRTNGKIGIDINQDEVTNVSNESNIEVFNKSGSKLILDDIIAINWGDNATINVTLFDNNADPLANKVINLTIKGISYNLTSDINGCVVFTVPGLGIGNHSFRITFDGDEYYNGFSIEGIQSVGLGLTDLSFNLSTIVYRDVVVVNVTLCDKYGNPLANKIVWLTIDFNTFYLGMTNSSGFVRFVISGLPGGIFKVVAFFDGGGNFSGSNFNGIQIVNRLDNNLSLGNLNSIYYGDDVFISVTIRDVKDYLLSNKILHLTIGGKTYKVTTNTAGVAVFTISNLEVGDYHFVVDFAGDRNFTSSNVSGIQVVNMMNTFLKLSNTIINYGVDTNIKLTLSDAVGRLVTNKILYLTINSVTYGVVTDSYGVGVFSGVYGLDVGSYPFTVVFKGDNNYITSNISGTQIVNKAISILTLNTTIGSQGSDVFIKVILKDDGGRLVSNKVLKLTINGFTYSTTTNNEGIATFVASNLGVGNYFFTVVFDGDKSFIGSNVSRTQFVMPSNTGDDSGSDSGSSSGGDDGSGSSSSDDNGGGSKSSSGDGNSGSSSGGTRSSSTDNPFDSVDGTLHSQDSGTFTPASASIGGESTAAESTLDESTGGSSSSDGDYEADSSTTHEIFKNSPKDLNDKNYLFGLIIGIIFAILFIFGFYKMGKNKGGI